MTEAYQSAEILRCKDIVDVVFGLTEGEGFIAGGFARYCLSKKDAPQIPSDIDVFCGDVATFERIDARLRAHPQTVRKSETVIEKKYEYRRAAGFHRDAYVIQIIKPANIANMVADGEYPRILDNFDFTIAKCAILPSGQAYCHPDFHEHDAESRLVVTNIHCPISSTKRVIKYCLRGFKISSGEILKLFEDYEARPAEWKSLIKRGLSEDTTLDDGEKALFVQAMYFD